MWNRHSTIRLSGINSAIAVPPGATKSPLLFLTLLVHYLTKSGLYFKYNFGLEFPNCVMLDLEIKIVYLFLFKLQINTLSLASVVI